MSGPGQSLVDRIKRNLVGLKMPRALEILDVTIRGMERGETTAIEAIDLLLTEELTIRENRRIKMALVMARLSAIKTLAGFDFAFQPSLDKNRIMALAELQFIDRAEVVHLIGPPGTGKSHLSLALGVECQIASKRDPLSRPIPTPSRPRESGGYECTTIRMRKRRCRRAGGRA
jgi:DNA replication protein DnaC